MTVSIRDSRGRQEQCVCIAVAHTERQTDSKILAYAIMFAGFFVCLIERRGNRKRKKYFSSSVVSRGPTQGRLTHCHVLSAATAATSGNNRV